MSAYHRLIFKGDFHTRCTHRKGEVLATTLEAEDMTTQLDFSAREKRLVDWANTRGLLCTEPDPCATNPFTWRLTSGIFLGTQGSHGSTAGNKVDFGNVPFSLTSRSSRVMPIPEWLYPPELTYLLLQRKRELNINNNIDEFSWYKSIDTASNKRQLAPVDHISTGPEHPPLLESIWHAEKRDLKRNGNHAVFEHRIHAPSYSYLPGTDWDRYTHLKGTILQEWDINDSALHRKLTAKEIQAVRRIVSTKEIVPFQEAVIAEE